MIKRKDWHCPHRAVANSRVHAKLYYHVCSQEDGHYGLHLCWCGISFTSAGSMNGQFVQGRFVEMFDSGDRPRR